MGKIQKHQDVEVQFSCRIRSSYLGIVRYNIKGTGTLWLLIHGKKTFVMYSTNSEWPITHFLGVCLIIVGGMWLIRKRTKGVAIDASAATVSKTIHFPHPLCECILLVFSQQYKFGDKKLPVSPHLIIHL